MRLLICVALALGGLAHADVLELPKGDDAVPLVVVLHGDREHAKPAAARWQKAVAKKGWALLAIDCPHELGCVDSWWQWDGDPSYVLGKIADVKKQRAISTVALVGWSGGASYIGWRAKEWTGIDRIVIHGGGMAPSSEVCAKILVPVYFLVGDRNPLHKLAIALRDHFLACKQEVTWDLVSGADHPHEEAALTPVKAKTILDWMVAH